MSVYAIHVARGADWKRVLPINIESYVSRIIAGLDLESGAGDIGDESIHSAIHGHMKVVVNNHVARWIQDDMRGVRDDGRERRCGFDRYRG